MFDKMKLKKEVKRLKEQISEIETKRSRSQAALVQAILEHRDPTDSDVEFFNKYTEEINEVRDKLQRAQTELDSM